MIVRMVDLERSGIERARESDGCLTFWLLGILPQQRIQQGVPPR
jgi:hypothetical protein